MRPVAAILLVAVGLGGCMASTPASPPTSAQTQSADSAQSMDADRQSSVGGGPEPSANFAEEVVNAEASPPATPTPEEVATQFAADIPQTWGLEVPGVLTDMDSDGIALTLDACGGPGGDGYDAELIDGLIARGVPATLFLNQRWVEANPDLALALAQNPLFEIANHGTSHRPLSVSGNSAYGIPGTSSALEAAQEVWSNHVSLTDLVGVAPRFFRSGTAHYDEVSTQIAGTFGEGVLGFTVNGDAGATLDAAAVRDQVAGAQPGSIIIAHMNQPQGETAAGLLAGVDDLLARGARLSFVENPR